jgi:hypothetical protein
MASVIRVIGCFVTIAVSSVLYAEDEHTLPRTYVDGKLVDRPPPMIGSASFGPGGGFGGGGGGGFAGNPGAQAPTSPAWCILTKCSWTPHAT